MFAKWAEKNAPGDGGMEKKVRAALGWPIANRPQAASLPHIWNVLTG